MAGTSLQGPIGVGSALEKARRIRGLTLGEASRDTRLRVDQLTALETEDFEALPGDAFVRGALRCYAQYLGVSPDKVLRIYARHAEDPVAPPPPEGLGRIERAIAATRIRDNQRFLRVGAATLVVLLLLFGLLARDRGAPAPAAIPTAAPPAATITSTIDAVLVARRPVEVTVSIDGAREAHVMAEGETLSFSADDELVLDVADGGSVEVTVSGRSYGTPGRPGVPWTKTFDLESIRDPTRDPGTLTTPEP
jgi:Helix-turn-helix domain